MDRLETSEDFKKKNIDDNLYSSMDRLETLSLILPITTFNKFIFQYG